jgi:DNA-binding CsgD family transcriptional regulator
MQILPRVARGLPDKSIAIELGITERAVRAQIAKLCAILNARSRAHAVALAVAHGHLELAVMREMLKVQIERNGDESRDGE